MADEEEEDQNVKYWRTKYELLNEDYCKTKERAESLETRLLEMCEESERRESEGDERIRRLDSELEESRRRIEQLEAACFRYKNQSKLPTIESARKSETLQEAPPETPESSESSESSEDVTLERPGSILAESESSNRSTPSPTGVTRSPEFHAGHHVICEYHKLPILAKGEGFIYGFRWNEANKIHVV